MQVLTPTAKSAIRKSKQPATVLAEKHGVHVSTIYRTKKTASATTVAPKKSTAVPA